jgi:hypothetical protein
MGLDLMADIVPFDLAGSLQAHNQLLAQRQQLQDQNALAQAVPLLQSDPQNAFATAAKTSPNAALKLLPYIKQMDDEKKAKLAERTDALGKVALTVEQYKDPVIRKAVAMSMLPDLAAHGITADDLQRGDWSDNGIQTLKNMPQTMGQLIAQSNADRTYQAGRSDHADTLANEVANRNVTIRGQNMTDARAKEANSGPKAWEVLTDPKTNTQFRYNPVTGQSTTLDGKQAYSPGGAQKMGGGGTPRSAASLAATMFVQEHPEATAQDVANFAADYAKGVKSVGAFATGKQGDLVRSFNVATSHLNTLDNLVGALNNGDVQAFNKFGNMISQQTGNPAPTNFDAAKAIVGDEIIKAIVGSGGALADRENAQNQISRASSPAQLRGVIKTYKELMAGQLRGLKKQYQDSTGRTDFESHLSPEARAELEPPPATGGKDTDALLKKYGIK